VPPGGNKLIAAVAESDQQKNAGGKIARTLFVWTAALAVTVIAVAISIMWVDHPIALWIHRGHTEMPPGQLEWLAAHVGNPLVSLAEIVLVGVVARAAVIRALPRGHYAAAFIASVSVLAAEGVKGFLQPIFGRPAPETWLSGNSSFIGNGYYGFHFFSGKAAYQSFPSGHMATACALIAVLWIGYPRWRRLYLAAALTVGAALVGTNIHFLSDVISEAFVGISVGAAATAIWNRVSSIGQVSSQ
jgi:membrane-associated phospholipid phosphatase